MVVNRLDSSALLSLYDLRSPLGASQPAAAPTAKKTVPTPPWRSTPTPAQVSATVKQVLAGRKLIDENAAHLDVAGASSDYRKLFALYQGLGALGDLAQNALQKNLSAGDKARISERFDKGLKEIFDYVQRTKLEKARLTLGETNTVAKSTLTVRREASDYTTPPLTTGVDASLPGLGDPARFTISIQRLNDIYTIPIDLGEMGDQPRSLANVVIFINQKLEAEGVETRLATERIPGEERSTKVGTKTVPLPPTSDRWSLKVKNGMAEAVSFLPDRAAGALYVAQRVQPAAAKAGEPLPAAISQLLKFQTDVEDVAAPPQLPGQSNWVDGRVFAENLGAEIQQVRQQVIGPDGSLFMLADVTGAPSGQSLKGEQDVALLKYDPVGKLVYTRTLGAGSTASGLALAVAEDGRIAIAGSVRGALAGAQDGPVNSQSTGKDTPPSDSFVTLFSPEGEELWTLRRGARAEDEASKVAFGADGSVYVAGRARSPLPGAEALGDWDAYLQSIVTDERGVPQAATQSFGSAGPDTPLGMVTDGTSLFTVSRESGRAVLRRFDLSSGQPIASASRDLGSINANDIVGLAVDGEELVIVGTTADMDFANARVLRPHAGGTDAFVLRVSADLQRTDEDAVAYFGGSGDDRATCFSLSAGEVWIGGSVTAELPDEQGPGGKGGFIASVERQGDIGWTRRLTSKDGDAAPTAIAADPIGASILDRLGLPNGALESDASERLSSHSAIRPGDKFTIRADGGPPATVTIATDETLDTLAQKIRRASGFRAKVTIGLVDGARQLKIEPASPRSILEIGGGGAGLDALKTLGVPMGVVRATSTKDGKVAPADGKGGIYGLSLADTLNLRDEPQVRHVLAELAHAQDALRSAYKDISAPLSAQTPQQRAAAAARASKAPAYITQQLANYQAALNRLTGGG